MLTQDKKISVDLGKSWLKMRLHNLHTQKKKNKIKAQIVKYPMGNMIELNKQIHASAISVRERIGVSLRNPNRKTKPGKETRLERLVK